MTTPSTVPTRPAPARVLTPTSSSSAPDPPDLRAAAELSPLVHGGVLVLVLEREADAGGIPRHSDHLGIREPGRFVSGPRYAQLLRDNAVKPGRRS